MLFSEAQIKRLNRSCPMLAGVKVGTKFQRLEKGDLSEIGIADVGINFPIFLTYEITTGAATGLEIFKANAPFKFQVLDVIIQCRGAAEGGTMQLTNGDDEEVVAAIICAVDKVITRAAVIDDGKATIDIGETLQVVCFEDGAQELTDVIGLVTVVIKKV